MKKFLITLVAFATIFYVADAKNINGLTVEDTLTPGVWCSNFDAAKAYSDQTGTAMLVFWANPGCSFCEKLETACSSSEFNAWQAQRKYVMVFSYGNRNVSKWILQQNKSLKNYPLMAFYQPGKTTVAFSGRSGGMPNVKKGSLDSQLMTAMDIFAGSTEPVKPIQPKEEEGKYGKFNPSGAKLHYAKIMSSNDIVGTMTIKVARAVKNQSKVTVTVYNTSAKKSSVSKRIECKADSEFNVANLAEMGALNLIFGSDDKFVGTIGSFTIQKTSMDVEKGNYTFSCDLQNLTVSDPDLHVIEKTVPNITGYFNGKKFDFGKSSIVKIKTIRENGDTRYELQGINDDINKPNSSALKLSYTSKTGVVKGNFKTYMSNICCIAGKPKLKKYSGKITGVFVGNTGNCNATIQKQSFPCKITKQ